MKTGRTRLVIAIVSTIFEEAAIVFLALRGLPYINIFIPFWLIITVMAAWLAYSIYTYRKGTHALRAGQLTGMSSMVGTKGKAVSNLNPEGWVRIRGELWAAMSVSGEILPGKEVLVTGQNRLKLEVSNDVETRS